MELYSYCSCYFSKRSVVLLFLFRKTSTALRKITQPRSSSWLLKFAVNIYGVMTKVSRGM